MARAGFTMVELLFIIVILGILSAVAVPQFVASRDDACYAKLRADLSETQTIIANERTKLFMQGKALDQAALLTYLQDGLAKSSNAKCNFTINSLSDIKATVGKNTLSFDAVTLTSPSRFKMPNTMVFL